MLAARDVNDMKAENSSGNNITIWALLKTTSIHNILLHFICILQLQAQQYTLLIRARNLSDVQYLKRGINRYQRLLIILSAFFFYVSDVSNSQQCLIYFVIKCYFESQWINIIVLRNILVNHPLYYFLLGIFLIR